MPILCQFFVRFQNLGTGDHFVLKLFSKPETWLSLILKIFKNPELEIVTCNTIKELPKAATQDTPINSPDFVLT
jgi:hypothetical protein